jgi:hypothetical protein
LIAVGLLLCSCAAGSTDEPTEEPVEVYVAPPKTPAPKPPAQPAEDTDAGPSNCVIDAYWVNDCYVVKIYCKDKPVHIEVSCGPGRPLWPWEIIPDPPYDRNNRK